ncbi:MAG: type transport system permease protein [Frankiaceae bacterium]|nr:type transport system permease protein [Frankiaceae bacterium]
MSDLLAARAPSAAAAAGSAPVGPGLGVAIRVVYQQQLLRVRVARVPLLFVAALQSVGILLLLRGVVDSHDAVVRTQVVAGSTVLVVAFVALNLLAQRFGSMRGNGALDYYGALPVPPAAVVLGTAASYATMAVPGTIVTAVLGILLYQLPFAGLVLLLPVVLLAGASLAGIGALLGLLAPKPELATVAGQLGMSAVLFLGIIPEGKLPLLLRPIRAAVPSTYAADAFAAALRPDPSWASIALDLAVCAVVALVSLALGGWALRRAVRR